MLTGFTLIEADKQLADCRIAIVCSKYNSHVVDRLLQGCLTTLAQAGVEGKSVTLIKVPGAYEIPIIVKQLAEQGAYTAIITLGAIIRGETPHFEFISQACADGIATVSLDKGIPVIFGVLTVDNMQQALDRSGDEESNKGSESALAALEMISVTRKIRGLST